MKKRREFLKDGLLLGVGIGSVSFAHPSLAKSVPARRESVSFDSQSELKIVRVESFTKGNATIVKVTTDDGSEGFGQLAPYNNDITTTVLHKMVVPYALGKDPYQPAAIADHCIEVNYKFPWSFVSRATSGLETALWDLRGKRENKSVCALLGGTSRPIPAYGSSMRRDITPAEEAKRLVKLRDELGFEAFKIRIGKVTGHNEDQWPGRTEEIIPLIRKTLGDESVLLADANSCYTPDKAIEKGKMLQDQNYYFFEEPCPFWELEWTAEVNQALSMHVAGGEQDNDLAQWRRMIAMNAVDITQPDICYLGGISRALAVARMSEEAGKVCVPHSANTSMITLFAMHLMAAIPNPAPYLEYSIENPEWAQGIYQPVLSVREGNVLFPDGPGWGVQVNEEWLKQAAYQVSRLEG